MKPDSKIEVLMTCADCGKELNRTKEMTPKECWENWTMIVMTSGFNAPRCPGGCRATFSDLNINTKHPILCDEKPIDFMAIKVFLGKTYGTEAEDYEAEHGKIGRIWDFEAPSPQEASK